MKRPIVIAVIGYIIGIIWGLYFNISIAFLYAFLIIIYLIYKQIKCFLNHKRKFRLFSISRYLRYLKLIFNIKTILVIIIFSIISNIVINIKNDKFNNLYKDIEDVELVATVCEDGKETKYSTIYTVKVEKLNNSDEFSGTYLYLQLNKKQMLEYGSIVKVKGKFNQPESARNTGGFDYKEYLKQKSIYGTVVANKVTIVKRTEGIGNFINSLRNKIKENIKNYLNDNTYPICLGLIFGDTSEIEDDVKEQFRSSNMSHILAVSGMHISYIILGVTTIVCKISGKRKAKIIVIIVLIFYSIIVGFSSSIARASIMGIMGIFASLIHRKNDVPTSIAISVFIILLYNPYLIANLGFQFSYMGTFGILLLSKNIFKLINIKKEKRLKLKKIVAVTISAQIFILPLSLYHFNTFGIYFLLTNILMSLIIGPVIIIGFIFMIFTFTNLGIVKILAFILDFFINIIKLISNISFLPLSKIYIRTPKIHEIIIFFLIVNSVNIIYSIKVKNKPNQTNLRIRYIIQVIKYKFRTHKTKYIFTFVCIIICTSFFIINSPKFLKVHFVDVGQGDCCFIETPEGKTILIDGGGSETGTFDVGKKTLIPYILDMGYTQVDYIIISHFDNDHVRSEFYL